MSKGSARRPGEGFAEGFDRIFGQKVACISALQAEPAGQHDASVSATGWLPIESAPRDGSAIILTNGEQVSAGSYMDAPPYVREIRDMNGFYIDQEESDGFQGWTDYGGGMQPDPTHWMPLPPPPEPSSTPVPRMGGHDEEKDSCAT